MLILINQIKTNSYNCINNVQLTGQQYKINDYFVDLNLISSFHLIIFNNLIFNLVKSKKLNPSNRIVYLSSTFLITLITINDN